MQKELAPEQVVMMASPEKALLDKVVTTVGLTLLGRVAASRYLLENLRLDEDSLRELDVAQMEGWLDEVPKRESMVMMLNVLGKL